jgi:hypothetical protein
LVHIAVHDAVQAIEKRFEPYHFETGPAYGSRSAAVAAAAHDVLVGDVIPRRWPRYTPSTTTTWPTMAWRRSGLGRRTTGSHANPALRRVNPDPLPPPFVGWHGSRASGARRPPFSAIHLRGTVLADAVPWMAKFDPFTLTSPRVFAPSRRQL